MPAPAPISIVQLTPQDAAVYREIRLEALMAEPEAFGSSYRAEKALPLSTFKETLKNSAVFAAHLDGVVAGMAAFAQLKGEKQSHKGLLWGMYVTPEQRGKGLGRALVGRVVAHARTCVELVTLSVVPDKRDAVRLYESFGFRDFGRAPKSLKLGDHYFDEMLMILEFDHAPG